MKLEKALESKLSITRKILFCKLCKSSSIVFSNKSFVQESNRLKSIYSLDILSCPNTALKPDKRKGIPDGRRYETITKKIYGKEKQLSRLKKACPNHEKNLLEHSHLYWLDSKNTKKLTNTKGLPKKSYIQTRMVIIIINVKRYLKPLNAKIAILNLLRH